MSAGRTYSKVGSVPSSPRLCSFLICLCVRQETAASIVHLVELLSTSASKGRPRGNLGVLDLCTGSGCIPLLFHHELYSRSENMQTRLRLVGMDISSTAVQLARDNLRLQNDAQRGEKGRCSARIESLAATRFIQADVLRSEDDIGNTQCMTVLSALQQLHKPGPRPEYDVLISNPPYISSKAFRTTTSRSVRKFEPKLALVPDNASGTPSAHDGDIFYPRLLDLVEQLNVKIVLFEVADMDQAERVASLAIGQGIWDGVEIWRDEPGVHRTQLEDVRIDDSIVRVRGAGHGRSVFAYRGDGI